MKRDPRVDSAIELDELLHGTPEKQGLLEAPRKPDIEAAAKTLASCMDYPWEYMPEQGREEMRKHAKAVIEAGLAKR